MHTPLPQFVLIIPDGAADRNCDLGGTPLEVARTPAMDFISRSGINGLVQTLYEQLPRESLVAQLGIMGWDPLRYYPNGRASAELRGFSSVDLSAGDLAFRANFVRMNDDVLVSYNAGYTTSRIAEPLIHRLVSSLSEPFPEFELYHQSDFRNTLVLRNTSIDAGELVCPEPHESHGERFDLRNLVQPLTSGARPVARRINEYVTAAAELLAGEPANALFPWSPSRPLRLPPFHEVAAWKGRSAVVASMEFLLGIGSAGGLETFRVGNGRPDTPYPAKGAKVLELLADNSELVICHINAPDEASHMRDLDCKIRCLEQVDRHIVTPVLNYFHRHPERLGGVMVVPDHYSNTLVGPAACLRREAHSLDPVPFALWNGCKSDACVAYSEKHARRGIYAAPLRSLDLLPLLLSRTPAGVEAGHAGAII